MQKEIPVHERYNLELRADLYNLYNHQNITGVNNTGYILNSAGGVNTATYQSSFGTVTNSNSSGFLYTPRQVAISLKLAF